MANNQQILPSTILAGKKADDATWLHLHSLGEFGSRHGEIACRDIQSWIFLRQFFQCPFAHDTQVGNLISLPGKQIVKTI